MTLINTGILKSPLSWLTIFLMVLIAGIAVHIICDFYSVNPAIAVAPQIAPDQTP